MKPNEKRCHYCNEIIPLSSKKCPKCNKSLVLAKWEIVAIIIVATLSLYVLAMEFLTNNKAQKEKNKVEERPCITFINNTTAEQEKTEICVNNGETIEPPEAPVIEDHEFIAWATHDHSLDGSEVFDFSKPITKSQWVFAHYKYTPKPLPPKFELLDHYISDESNQFAMYIEGRVQYNRSTDLSYIQIQFITYDSEGNTIGTCLANNSGLSGNGTWKFKAICLDGDKIDHYEFKDITGW